MIRSRRANWAKRWQPDGNVLFQPHNLVADVQANPRLRVVWRCAMIRQRGFTKLEFAIVVAIFGVLASALMVRINAIQVEAERTEVDLTIRNMRVGIQLAISERIMQGEEARIHEVAQASPVDFVGHRPRDFNPGSFPEVPGQWAYDSVRRELAYVPRLPEAFDGATELRWSYIARVNSFGQTVGASLVGLN